MSTSNPYAPPRGTVRDMATESGELAGRGARLIAAILDSIIMGLMVYVPALAVMAATGGLAQLDRPESEIDPSVLTLPIVVGCIGAIAWAWITLLLVARHGQTMAKRVLDIKVVRSDGSKASLGRIFWLRNVVNGLLGVIPLYGLVDILFIFGERRQCIHDLIADTIVVKA